MTRPIHPLMLLLTRRRLELGLSQVELARRLHVTRAVIGQRESGVHGITIDRFVLHAQALGLRVALVENRPRDPQAGASRG